MRDQRVSYNIRLAARRRYDEWETRFGRASRAFRQEQREMYYYPHLHEVEVRRRSETLLCRHLTDRQQSQLARWGWFEVVGKSRWRKHMFRIHETGLIYEHKPNGQRRNFCIMALEPGFPDADWMLTVKLLIEANCRKFLDTAHAHGWYPARTDTDVPF